MANGSLALIGIGISDEKDISLRGLDTLKACDIVFAESYTNLMAEGTLDRLSKLCGKKITLLSREQVEGEKRFLQLRKSAMPLSSFREIRSSPPRTYLS